MKRDIEQLEKQLDAAEKQKKALMNKLNQSIMNDDSHLTEYNLLIKKINTPESINKKYRTYENEKEVQNWQVCRKILTDLINRCKTDCHDIQSLIGKIHVGPSIA